MKPIASYSPSILPIFVAIAIVGILAHTLYTSTGAEIVAPAVPQWTPRPEPEVEAEPPEPTPDLPSLPPVRVRNAFDEAEVFEFPAGTSMEDARNAVAETLRRRALERQH